MFDLTFFMIIFISRCGQEYDIYHRMVLLLSALLAGSLHLLTAFISPKWDVLTNLLLSHHKVHIFTRAAFSGVLMVTNFLNAKLSVQHTDTRMESTVDEVHCLFQLSLASLQFLQSLCQKTLFRERLVKDNKELCEEGGVLKLVLDIMKLPRCDDSKLMAVIYQLKSKALSTMLHLCEVESPSFLDMSSSTSHGLELAKSIVSEVLELLKMMFHGDLKDYPRGSFQLNVMRLIEIFSDDSGFRSYIILNLTQDLTHVFSQPVNTFLSTWCFYDDDDLAQEIIMNFNSVSAAEHVLGVIATSFAQDSTISTPIIYAKQRSSLLVKILANLSCSVPGLCKEGENLFAIQLLECLNKQISSSGADRTAVVTGNLNILLALAGNVLKPDYVNKDDVDQLRKFIRQLKELLATQKREMQQVEEVHDRGESSTAAPQRSCADRSNGSILNAFQIGVIEGALLHEPDMQRKAASIRHWADELSTHGPKVTAYQLKYWLLSRRGRLARAAARGDHTSSGGDNTVTENQGGSGADPTPDPPAKSPVDEHIDPSPSASQGTQQKDTEGPRPVLGQCGPKTKKDSKLEPGEYVMLVNNHGDEIGRGNIHLSQGVWFEKNLVELGLCVVDVTNISVSKQLTLPYPCDAGTTFAEAEMILGKMRVLWNTGHILRRS